MRIILRTGVLQGEDIPDVCTWCRVVDIEWDRASRKKPTYHVRLACSADDTMATKRKHT